MRTFTSWSVATTLALVVGVVAAPPTQAADVDLASAAHVPAPSTSGRPEAAGLVVTSSLSATSIERAAVSVLGGEAALEDVVRGPGTTRVIGFEDPVPGGVAERLAARLDDQPGVSSVEPDYVRSAADAPPVSVNDPFFPLQTHLWDTTRPAGGYSTRAPAFWQRSRGSAAVRVAVLDTGSTNHPDLVWSGGYDAIDNDADPTDPGDFHGTHVAGIVAAQADNRRGVAGVAPGVSIVPVRVLDGTGVGRDSTTARGILWAAGLPPAGAPANPAPVKVITMSLAGAGPCTSTLSRAIATARSRGIVVVAAAGNAAKDAAGYAPANCPGVIAVGATDETGARATFSNTGATVDISAPGVRVASTYAETTTSGQVAYDYAYLSGTSMAAPEVAGGAALLASVGLSGAQIEAALPTLVRPATTPGTAGILDLGAYVPAVARVATRVSATVASSKVRKGKRAVVRVRLRSTSSSARPTGRIRVFDGSRIVRTAYVSAARRGSITVKTPRLGRKGVHRLRVVYLGEGAFDASRSVVRRVRVR
jgi:serine protease